MRRIVFALLLTTLATALAGCPFFTRDEPSSGAAGAAADEHAGHDHR